MRHRSKAITTVRIIHSSRFDRGPRLSYAEAVLNPSDISPKTTKILMSLACGGVVVGLGLVVWRHAHRADQPDPSSVGSSSKTREAESTKGWSTYHNDVYGFEFKYPDQITVVTAEDRTGGQIPDRVFLHYTSEKQRSHLSASGRILVWENVHDTLKEWLSSGRGHGLGPTLESRSEIIADVPALVQYLKNDGEGPAATFVAYLFKDNSTVFEIIGYVEDSSPYATRFLPELESIISTFRLTW